MSRIVLVYNPNSSKYRHVKQDVLESRTKLFKDFTLSEYTIKKIGFVNNVKDLQKELRDKDICLAIGGDATAAIAANAIMASQKDIILAVLPYGNFNDLARTLGTMKLKDLDGKLISLDGSALNPIPPSTNLYPLEIYVDDKFWRYATCYVTIGMTAEAVELFDDPSFRKHMQKGHKSSITSYIQLAKWYFKNRHTKVFLPEFTINQAPSIKGASDYAALSGSSMCRVMKGGDDFKDPKIFRSKSLRTVSFPKLFILMAQSILFRTPGNETTRDILEFKEKATVELQAEGEYQIFSNIKKIEIKKSRRPLKVISK